MDLSRFYRVLIKSWTLLLALALVGAAAGAAVSYLTPSVYTSSERLFMSFEASASSTPGDLVQANNYAIQKVFSYVDVATSPVVLQGVIDTLSLSTTVEDLAEDISVSVPLNSIVIKISATAATPQDAATLAATTSSVFTDYVINTLESPAGGGPGPVRATILEPAIPPQLPSTTSTLASVVLGGLIGLIVATLACLVSTFRDKRVHTRREIESLGIPYIAGIPESPARTAIDSLAIRDRPDSAEAEAYRRVRTRISLVGDPTPRSIALMSSIGGEGASTVTANLALAYADGGARVAVLDADWRFGRQGELLGAPVDVAAATRTATEKVVVVIVPSASTSERPSLAALESAIRALEKTFDVVLVDSAPVLQADEALVVADIVDRTILVAASGRVDVAEVGAAVEQLRGLGSNAVGTVLTRVPERGMDADPALSVPTTHRARQSE